jgi:hypothetical protein
MRAFMIIAFATMLFLSAWANYVDSAGASQTISNATTTTSAGLPSQPGY